MLKIDDLLSNMTVVHLMASIFGLVIALNIIDIICEKRTGWEIFVKFLQFILLLILACGIIDIFCCN